MIDVLNLGKRLSFYRNKAGLTQSQLAKQLRVTPQAVSKWERGLSCPDITILDELAKAFDATVGEVLGVQE